MAFSPPRAPYHYCGEIMTFHLFVCLFACPEFLFLLKDLVFLELAITATYLSYILFNPHYNFILRFFAIFHDFTIHSYIPSLFYSLQFFCDLVIIVTLRKQTDTLFIGFFIFLVWQYLSYKILYSSFENQYDRSGCKMIGTSESLAWYKSYWNEPEFIVQC